MIERGQVGLRFADDLPMDKVGSYGNRVISVDSRFIHEGLQLDDFRRATSVVVHEGQHFFDDVLRTSKRALSDRRIEFRAQARQLDFGMRMNVSTPIHRAYKSGGYRSVGDRIEEWYGF